MTLSDIFLGVISPFFYWAAPNQRIYWLYLLTAIALAVGVFAVGRYRRKEGLPQSFLQYCFPKEIYLHHSAVVDYKFYVINRIAFVFFIAPLIVGTQFSATAMAGLLDTVRHDWAGALDESGPIGMAFLTLCVILAHDFSVFITHLMQHRVPFLWEFHKVHHSAEVLTPLTVYRMHPVDDIFTGAVVGLTTGMIYGVFSFLFSAAPSGIAVNGLNIVMFFFYVFGFNLRHSHVWLPLRGIWGHIFISPAHHQIHHGTDAKFYDRNYGLIFAFWDWIAGSLYVPEPNQSVEFGLGEESKEYDGVWQLYTLPFVKILSRLRGATAGQIP